MELDPRLELALPLYLQRGMQLRLGKLALDLYLHPLLLPHTRPSEDNISIDLRLSPKTGNFFYFEIELQIPSSLRSQFNFYNQQQINTHHQEQEQERHST